MKNKRGFASFISILTISAVAIAIAVSITSISINGLYTSFAYSNGTSTDILATSCIEEGLIRLRDDASYTGSSLIDGVGTCTIAVSVNGNNHTIMVNAVSASVPAHTENAVVLVRRAGGDIRMISRQKQ